MADWLGMCGRHNSNIIIPQFEKKKGMRVRGDKAAEEIITNRTNRVYVAVLKETQSGGPAKSNLGPERTEF